MAEVHNPHTCRGNCVSSPERDVLFEEYLSLEHQERLLNIQLAKVQAAIGIITVKFQQLHDKEQ